MNFNNQPGRSANPCRMETIRDLVGSVLSRVAQGLKLNPSELEKIRAWKTKLEQAKRDNHDRVQDFKDGLRELEARVLKLHGEHQRESSGGLRRVVAREMDQACSELELKEERLDLLFANIERQAAALEKIAQLEETSRHGVSEAQADELAIQLEEAFDDLEQADEAMRGAQSVTYRRKESGKVDVAKHVRQIRGEPAVFSSTTASIVARLRKPNSAPEQK